VVDIAIFKRIKGVARICYKYILISMPNKHPVAYTNLAKNGFGENLSSASLHNIKFYKLQIILHKPINETCKDY
jgi:hypothetical protein